MINRNEHSPALLLLESNPGESLWGALEAAPRSAGEFEERVRALHALNRSLWELEERVRSRELGPETVMRLKREIDRANLARHGEVAAIDRTVDGVWPEQRAIDDPAAVLNSESVGQMVDRMSILRLKLAAHHADPGRRGDLDRRRRLLARCLDRVVSALRRGEGVRQSFDEAKTYGA